MLARIAIDKYKEPQALQKIVFACDICGADGLSGIQNTSNLSLHLNYFKVVGWRVWSKPTFHHHRLLNVKKDLLIWMKTGRKSCTLISHSIGFLKASLVMKGACIVHIFVWCINIPWDTETNCIITSRFLQLGDYKFTLSKRFTSGIGFGFSLPLLHHASGGEKEECDQETAQAKLLMAAEAEGEICVTSQWTSPSAKKGTHYCVHVHSD